MPNYTLNVDFDPGELAPIYAANEQVTIVKQSRDGKPVAWVAFVPFQNNTVTWKDSYALYASNTLAESGAIISQLSNTAASPGLQYAFAEGKFDSGTPDSDLPPNTYDIVNQMAGFNELTFGLAQDVQVNGTAQPNHPINAQIVPLHQSAQFTPLDKITVFLQSNVQSGMVLTTVKSASIELSFGGATTSRTLSYRAGSGWTVVNALAADIARVRPALHAAVDTFIDVAIGRRARF
jgi:hypothetical protein